MISELRYKVFVQAQSYTNYFADALVAEAKRDSRIVGIHAAMGGGTGMNRFEKVRLTSAYIITGESSSRVPVPDIAELLFICIAGFS